MQRRRRGEPIVQRDWGDNRRFKFSLSGNECLEFKDKHGDNHIYRINGISEGDIELTLHWDARTQKERRKTKSRERASGEKLRKGKARKVRVTYLGCVIPAND